jgi:ferrous iron transport protein B
VPVLPTVAHMGIGLSDLFAAALVAARAPALPPVRTPGPHLAAALEPLRALLAQPAVVHNLCVPLPFLCMQLAQNNDCFAQELASHLPQLLPQVRAAREAAALRLPRPLSDELHADRHHQAAILHENVSRFAGTAAAGRWQQRLLVG